MIALDAGWRRDHPLPKLGSGKDKAARGSVLVVGGSALCPGACLVTGEAALRAGAGRVRLGTIDSAAAAIGVAFPESAVIPLPAGADGEIAADAGQHLQRSVQSCDALVLGPGMMGSDEIASLIRAVLSDLDSSVPLLLDAGAIAALTDCNDTLAGRSGGCVITPHHGELARLTGRRAEDISAAPADAAREVAEKHGTIVVLKDATTFVALPEGTIFRHKGKAPGLGTAGSGDVLAGIVAGLLARGVAPAQAAAWGAIIHGRAGRVAGKAFGKIGYLARDLLPYIPMHVKC